MNIYIEKEYCPSKFRKRKNGLIKVWEDYGYGPCSVVDTAEEAEWVVSYYTWNDFVSSGETDLVDTLRKSVKGKTGVLVWAWGDKEALDPGNGITIMQSGSSKGSGLIEAPYVTGDPIELWFNGDWVPSLVYPIPTVGFCGRSYYGLSNMIYGHIKKYTNRERGFAKEKLGYMKYRNKVLDILQVSDDVVSDFKRLSSFGGGIHSNDNISEKNAKIRFINNLMSNVYCVCIRGAGNFSTRFYECLACGRIPILIDTNCQLPLKEEIDWDSHILRIDINNVDQLPGLISRFHNDRTELEIQEHQASCRALWTEHLSGPGFVTDLPKYLR